MAGRQWVAPDKGVTYSVSERGNIIAQGITPQKISGTSLGALMGVSPYSTPFCESTKLMGLWNESGIGDKPAVITGHMLEERIIDYQSQSHPELGAYFKAEDLFEKREGEHKDWASDFEDDVFCGHLDGVLARDGKDYIIEVKTANIRNVNKYWIDDRGNVSPPPHYLWQAYLYNHFYAKQDRVYFMLGVVTDETYKNPNLWVPNRQNCYLFEIPVNQEMVSARIEALRQVYKESIARGISLDYNPENPLDVEVMTHLKDISGTSETLEKLINDYTILHSANQKILDEHKDAFKLEDNLKDRIKDVMSSWNLAEAGTVTLKSSERTSFDFDKARRDGFDLSAIEQYIKKTTVKTVSTKKERK